MKENEKPRPIIHIKTGEFGPHGNRVAFLPKNSGDKKYIIWIWTLIAILVGISVAYFTYDSGRAIADLLSGHKNDFSNSESPAVENASSSISVDETLGASSTDSLLEKAGGAFINGKYFFPNPNYILPRTSSIAYLVADVDTGEVIIEKNPDMVLPIASVSKLINALVSEDVLNRHQMVTVSRSSIDTYGTLGGLKTGEKILVNDLFYPLLMESSNDAAEILARAYGRDIFLEKMNAKAKSLKMASTSFDDPSGLSAGDVSSANDLFTLAKYIQKSHPDLWDITRIREYAILSHDWVNNNPFMHRTAFLGGKNGYTYEADRTTVSIFEVNIAKQKRRIAIIDLKSDNLADDVDSIVRFLEKNVGFVPDGQDLNATTTPSKS